MSWQWVCPVVWSCSLDSQLLTGTNKVSNQLLNMLPLTMMAPSLTKVRPRFPHPLTKDIKRLTTDWFGQWSTRYVIWAIPSVCIAFGHPKRRGSDGCAMTKWLMKPKLAAAGPSFVRNEPIWHGQPLLYFCAVSMHYVRGCRWDYRVGQQGNKKDTLHLGFCNFIA